MAKVDFLNHAADLRVLVLGSLGFSTAFICASTGLSPGQVVYRLGRRSVKRGDYRSGKGEVAQEVLANSQKVLARRIRDRLARNGEPGE